MTLNQKLMTALAESQDAIYGLGYYHQARRIKNALRCKTAAKRLHGVRKAVAMSTVTAWLNGDGKIELRRGACTLLVL